MQKLSFEDPTLKTLSPQMRDSLARQIKADIDKYCVTAYTDEHRSHLGASVIGEACARKIWYGFRWVKFEMFNGRMLRLFERGQREEARIIEWLRGTGMTVWEIDPATGKQFRIYGAQGHYGGSADAFAELPNLLPYIELNGLKLLLEFKTHNTKSFQDLIKNKLNASKPKHYAQMCSYGVAYGFKYGIYCAVNKNDDDIHLEIVELDPSLADDLVKKAEDIINAKAPPPKISLQPAFFECSHCAFRGVCHYNEPVEINCRSCRHATPIANAQWHCGQFNQTIPAEFIAQGCENHHGIG